MVTAPMPYYFDDSVTLFHGDCREVLPLIETGGGVPRDC